MSDCPARGCSRIVAVIRDLSFCRSLADVMGIVRREARDLTAADGVTFVLRDGNQCYYAEENAIGPLWKGRRFPMRSCISGWVMLNRQVAAIEDIYSDPRIPIDAYRPTFVNSLAMVPVRADDPIGAIGAYWANRHEATGDELEVLQVIADAAALALENIRLYDGLQSAVQKAEALNRAKDEWISVLSHELRTPLTPILGWARMLRTTPMDPRRQEHAFEVIERNVMSEIRLVEELLDVSRMMTGTAHIEHDRVDIAAVVDSSIDTVQEAALQKGIAIAFGGTESPLTLAGDGARLQQAVCNLLNNALKYTPAGGRIEVEVSRSDGMVTIAVRDTGTGFVNDMAPRLFERFERADSSTTRNVSGLGLGLFLVKTIAELHGGSVTAHSDGPGTGSLFAMHLPMNLEAAKEGKRRKTDPSVRAAGNGLLQGVRVMVVDDDADARDLLHHCLSSSGAQVLTADTVASAMSSCADSQQPPDAVISDLAMPEEDGFVLLSRIRQMPAPLGMVPVIALTAHASPADGRRAIEAGFQLYLSKPIDPAAVALAVKSVVQSSGTPRLFI